MMAIAEGLPVGSEVAAVAAAGKTSAVDGTAFAASFTAADKSAGGLWMGTHAVAVAAQVAPVKGRQDLVGWDAGAGLPEQDGFEVGVQGDVEQTVVGPGAATAGSDAVSSSIGRREVLEGAPVGGGNQDLQQAAVGEGTRSAWTAGDGAATVQGSVGTDAVGEILQAGARLGPVSHASLVTGLSKGLSQESRQELPKELLKGFSKDLPKDLPKEGLPTGLQAVDMPRKDAGSGSAALPVKEVPSWGRVALNALPTENVARKAEVVACAEGKEQVAVSAAAVGARVVIKGAEDGLPATVKTESAKIGSVETEAVKREPVNTWAGKVELVQADATAGAARTAAAKTIALEPQRAVNAGAIQAGQTGIAASGAVRKAPVAVATETAVRGVDLGGALVVPSGVVSSGVVESGVVESGVVSSGGASSGEVSSGGASSGGFESGANLVAHVSIPVGPVAAASAALGDGKVNEVQGKTAGGTEAAAASEGVPVAVVVRAGERGASFAVAETGVRGVASAKAAAVSRRGHEAALKVVDGEDATVLATTASAMGAGDGSSAFPVVVGVAAAVPAVMAAPAPSEAGLGIQVGAAGKGKDHVGAVVKEKDGKDATGGEPRVTAETRGVRVATAEPLRVATSSPLAEAPGAAKVVATHDGGAAASVTGVTGASVAASNAHGATAPGWNGGMVTSEAPARTEGFAGTAHVAVASGAVRAEAGGLGSEAGAGLSSGLLGSGPGHTTLQATPTVLEVGIPGGTHGWLKIRAELSEGGAVQASVSSATVSGQETLRKELPAMSAYLQSEHVPVSLQMAHGVATVAEGTGRSAGDGFAAGLGSGSGAGSQAGANPEQSRNDAAGFGEVSAGSGDKGGLGSGRQQGADDGLGIGSVGTGSADGVAAAVTSADLDWMSPAGYGGISLTTGGSWVNVIA